VKMRRTGHTLIEVTIALALLAIVAAIVVQSLVWSMRDRARLATHHAATELAANVLEAARAQPFDKLDKAWADAQTIPTDMEAMFPQGKLIVAVEALKDATQARRFTVEVQWQVEPDMPARSVTMATVLTGREVKKGATP